MENPEMTYSVIMKKLNDQDKIKNWNNFVFAVFDYMKKEWLVEGAPKPTFDEVSESTRHVFFNNKNIHEVIRILTPDETAFLISSFIATLTESIKENKIF